MTTIGKANTSKLPRAPAPRMGPNHPDVEVVRARAGQLDDDFLGSIAAPVTTPAPSPTPIANADIGLLFGRDR